MKQAYSSLYLLHRGQANFFAQYDNGSCEHYNFFCLSKKTASLNSEHSVITCNFMCLVHWVNVLKHIIHGCYVQD